MRYRRANVKGGTYFFTVNLAERKLRLLVEHIDVLRDAVRPVGWGKPAHPNVIRCITSRLVVCNWTGDVNCEYIEQ